MNPAEEQARRDYEQSIREQRNRDEWELARLQAAAAQKRVLEEAARAQREELARLQAERARQRPFR